MKMKIVTISVATLIAITVIAFTLLLRHHPIPHELKFIGNLNVAGHVIKTPFEVFYVDSFADGGSMMFGIKDADSTAFTVVCEFGDSEHRFQNLLLYTGFPAFDGQNNPQSEEITDNVELIRNVLYYTMKKSGFHGSETEFLHAQSLYPDLFTRFAR